MEPSLGAVAIGNHAPNPALERRANGVSAGILLWVSGASVVIALSPVQLCVRPASPVHAVVAQVFAPIDCAAIWFRFGANPIH